jgi:hypothetical protein
LLCLVSAGAVTRLALAAFTLAWTHSIEKVEWQEDWRVDGDRLVLTQTRIRGSGAGMEPGSDAVLRDGWFVSHPDRRLPELRLARSGVVPDWRLCDPQGCRTLGELGTTGSVAVLKPCP